MTTAPTPLPLNVLVGGAGIAGLVTALALMQRGISVQVIEQAHALHEIGAGLQVGPNGTRVLLDLGLGPAMQQVVCEAAAKEVRHWQTGQSWKLFDLGQDCVERFGAPYWMVHRGDFHRVLLEAVMARQAGCVRLASRLKGFTQDGASVLAHLAGEQAPLRADVLIGADGVHSMVRQAMGLSERPAFTGLMAWRGVAQAGDLPHHLRRPVGVNWVGPGGHVITYPLRGGTLFNFVGIVEGRDWQKESWTEPGTHAECLADFAGWHPDVRGIIERLDQPFKWALIGREPMAGWADGRVCVLGDAAHPTLPFLAQGANMAIEDGLVLARCLAAGIADPPRALRRFEAMRAARTADIVRRSRDTAARFHNPLLADPAASIAYITREWEPESVRQRYDWLFEYDACSVQLTG